MKEISRRAQTSITVTVGGDFCVTLLPLTNLSQRKRLQYENLMRCDAHREALLDIFEKIREK